MEEKIIEIIENGISGINIKKLQKKTNLELYELQDILSKLKLEGKILQLGNKYIPFPDDLNIGTVIASTTGKKYISYNQNKSISIPPDLSDEVILHDVVSFKINSMNKPEIISIIDRPLGKIACEVINYNGKKKIVPYHSSIQFILSKEEMETLNDGDIILVDTNLVDIGDYSKAKLIKKIGRRDDPLIDDIIIATSYGFDNEYTEEYLEEVKKIPTSVQESDLVDRVDFRYQNCFTIDGIYTKDMDDGVYGEILNDDIIRVYVHIADVSHYIKPNSKIFERACNKTTSLYMNNSVFPMLHSTISNGICSLNPNEDRLAKTVIMDIDKSGRIIQFNIVKSVINSKMKMNYDDCDNILLNGEIPSGYEPFLQELAVLKEVTDRLESKYIKKGKLTFANTEQKIIYDENNNIEEIKEPEYSPSAKIIENLMIAANETVASWLYNMEIPAIYRILEQPSKETINEAIDMLNKYGYNIRHITNTDDHRAIQKILEHIRNYDAYPLISQILIMSMKRARYSTENIGHYALGSEAYLHFTSPIRRLPDLLVHTICDLLLDKNKDITKYNLNELETKLENLAIRSSEMERRADMAEIDAKRRLIIETLSTMIGCKIEAIVCEINKLIRIKLMGIDTNANGSNLSNNFMFDTKRKQYYDINCGEYLTLGTKVIVQLLDANSTNRSIKVSILSIVETNSKEHSKKKVLKQNI